jgi:hypothetical protein
MLQKLYFIVSGFVFLLVGFFHIFRLVYHWPFVVGTHAVPFLLSYIGGPVSLGYAFWAGWLLFSKRSQRSIRPDRDLG